MRSFAIPTVLLALAACGTTPPEKSQFVEPNALMGEEIRTRVDQLQFQHRDELFNSLLWLAQTGEQAIPALLDGLRHREPKVRSNCAWVLGSMADRRVIPHLQPLVRDQHESVRLEAARTLVLLGDLQHVPLLVEALDSPKLQVRFMCHEALKTATGRDFGYDHLSDDELARAQAIYGWRQWWGEQAGDPFFASSYAEQRGLKPTVATPPAAPAGETATPPAGGEPATTPGPGTSGSGTSGSQDG